MACSAATATARQPDFARHQGQIGHRGRQIQLESRLDPAEVAGLADAQLDQPRQPMLYHHPSRSILVVGIALLQRSCLLQQGFLRVDQHSASLPAFGRDALGPQLAYPTHRPVEMDDTGQWFLRAPGGRLERVHSSPLEETADGCMEMRNGILEATRFKNFVAGLLIFPDMRRREEMERVALGKHCVFIVWGLDNLQEDLERIVKEAEFRRPPPSRISENEWTCLHELQYRGAQGLREGDRTMRDNGQGPVEGWEAERQFTFGSATITIQHLDTLIVQQCPLHRDTDDGPLMPVA